MPPPSPSPMCLCYSEASLHTIQSGGLNLGFPPSVCVPEVAQACNNVCLPCWICLVTLPSPLSPKYCRSVTVSVVVGVFVLAHVRLHSRQSTSQATEYLTRGRDWRQQQSGTESRGQMPSPCNSAAHSVNWFPSPCAQQAADAQVPFISVNAVQLVLLFRG